MIEQVLVSACLSGLFAGLVAIGASLLIEKFGGVVGGTLGASPTTIIPAGIGIALEIGHNRPAFIQALFTIPLGMFMNALFLTVWRFLPSKIPTHWKFSLKLGFMITISLSLWFILAVIVVFVEGALPQDPNIMFFIGLGATVLLLVFALFLVLAHPAAAPSGKNPVSKTTLALRGVMAGCAVFVAVMMTLVNDVAAGIAATFPAIFCTTMVSLWISQDAAVSVGAIGPLILGSVSVPIYGILFCLSAIVLRPEIKNYFLVLVVSACTAWFGSIIGVSFPSYVLLQYKTLQDEQQVVLEELKEPDETTKLFKRR